MADGNGGTAVAEKKPLTFRQQLATITPRLKNLLPDYIAPERYLSLALMAIARDDKLTLASREAPETVLDSVLRAAQLGLEIGGAVPGAHLVAFRNNAKNRTECQMIPDYRGLIILAVKAGAITSGDARVVYEGEAFKLTYGSDEKIIHEPDFAAIDGGKVLAAYFLATLPDGAKKFEVMTKAQIDKIRSMSKAKDAMAWREHFPEMARKTVTKRFLKYVPLDPNNAAARALAMAIETDNREESGEFGGVMDFEDEAVVNQHAANRTAERVNDLAQRMGRDVTEESQQAAATRQQPADDQKPAVDENGTPKNQKAAQQMIIDDLKRRNIDPDSYSVAQWVEKHTGMGKLSSLGTKDITKLVKAIAGGDLPIAPAEE